MMRSTSLLLLAGTLAMAPALALAQSEPSPGGLEEAQPELQGEGPSTAASPEGASEGALQPEEPSPRRPAAPEVETPPIGPPPGAGTLTLEEAQRTALERSTTVRSLALEIEAADAMIQQAWGYLLPSIGADIQYLMADQPTTVAFGVPGMEDILGPPEEIVVRQQHVATLGVSVRQPIIRAPAITGLQTAHDARELTEMSVEQARRQLSVTVSAAFYAVITARRTVGALDRQLALAQQHVDASRARLEAQAGLAIDVARAELQVETLRMQRENGVLGYENVRDSLALLMNIPPSELPRLAEPPEPEARTATVEDLVGQARSDRVDLDLSRRQIALAERQRTSVWMSFVPSLDLAWSLTQTLTDLGGFGDRRTSWTLAVVANFPLFDGGVRYGRLRETRARIRQAELRVEALEQSIAVEVRSAYRAWQTSIATLESSERQLTLAREAHRLAIAAYQAGAASNLEVVTAQQSLAGAEVDLELRRLGAQLSLIQLLATLEVPAGAGGAASMGGAPR